MLPTFLASAIACLADPSPKAHDGRDYHLDVEAQTNLPIDVGGRISVEFPHRLRLSTSLGGLPGGYVKVINGIAISTGGYDKDTALVVEETLEGSLVWRTHFGWRPLKKRGFYFEAGYGFASLGGGLAGSDALVLAGVDDEFALAAAGDYSVDTKLHMLDVEIGYQFLVARSHIPIRLALGYAGALGSNTEVTPEDNNGPARLMEARTDSADQLATYLDDKIFSKYVHTLVVTVGIGFRIF